eukprot:1555991-Rhodomonas_salina.2
MSHKGSNGTRTVSVHAGVQRLVVVEPIGLRHGPVQDGPGAFRDHFRQCLVRYFLLLRDAAQAVEKLVCVVEQTVCDVSVHCEIKLKKLCSWHNLY